MKATFPPPRQVETSKSVANGPRFVLIRELGALTLMATGVARPLLWFLHLVYIVLTGVFCEDVEASVMSSCSQSRRSSKRGGVIEAQRLLALALASTRRTWSV